MITAESYELTASQLLVWNEERMYQDGPVYNTAVVFRIAGAVDLPRFREAFGRLIDRCDALRIRLRTIDGLPRQVFEPSLDYTPDFLDLSTGADPGRSFGQWIAQHSAAKFDYPLFDCALIRLDSDHHAWYLGMHHIITDAWAVSLVYRRMTELYHSSEGEGSYPGFEQYVQWEQKYRKSHRYAADEEYWNKKLADLPEPLTFYSGRLRGDSTRVERRYAALGEARSDALRGMAKGAAGFTEDMALSNLLATLVFAYLHRITGQSDILIGAPFHMRRSKAFRETAGLMMTVAPLRIRISGAETFGSLAVKVQSEALKTMQHIQYVVSNPVEAPVFQVLVNYYARTFDRFGTYAVEVEPIHVGYGVDLLAIQIENRGRKSPICLCFDLNCEVFDPIDRDVVIEHFTRVVDAFIEDPNQHVGGLQIESGSCSG